MPEGFIPSQMRRTNRNLFITSLVITLVVAAIFAGTRRYWFNYFAGPFATPNDQLIKTHSADDLDRYFVTVQGTSIDHTGYEHVTTTVDKYTHKEKSREVDGAYLALEVDDHILLVKADTELTQTKLSGFLTGFTDSVDAQVFAAFRKENPEVAAMVLPVMLDVTGFRGWGTVGLVIMVLTLAICARNFAALAGRSRDSTRHPIWVQLAKLGDARDLSARLDEEIRATDVVKLSSLTITRSWLLNRNAYGLNMFALKDLVWMFKKVTAHKKAFVTVSKTYEAIIWARNGEKLELQWKEPAIDQLFGTLTKRVPWILAGWTAELEKAWLTQRASVIGAVDQRKAEITAGKVEAPTGT